MERRFKSTITILFAITFMISTMAIILPAVFAADDSAITTDFYVYTPNDDGGYTVSLNSDFKDALNSSDETTYIGEISEYHLLFWNTGDPLPNPDPDGEYNGKKVTDMSDMFKECHELANLDLSSFNTQNVTNMKSMFAECNGLVALDVSNFDTSNVTNMSGMFFQCQGLTTLDVGNFDTSSVTDMSGMFFQCQGLTTLEVSNFDTSNVTTMNGLFGICEGLTSLDVSNFDTSQVTDMTGLFAFCEGLTSIDVSHFDTSNVTDMRGVFCDCKALTTLNVSNFDTDQVLKFEDMFKDCSGLIKLDISNFNIIENADIDNMFAGCSSSVSEDVKPVAAIVKSLEVKAKLNDSLSGINNKDLEILVISSLTINDNLDKIYDGNPVADPKDITQTGNTKEPEYTWYQKQASGEWKLINSAPVNCGEYKVVGTVAINGDYYSCTGEKEFEIKANDNVSKADDNSTQTDGNSPKTDDMSNLSLWIFLSTISAGIIVAKRRKKIEE